MNIGMLKTMLGALGFDAKEVEKQVGTIVENVGYSTREIAAQGAMLRSICKHLDLPVIPQEPLNKEIDHG